jgi:hypothetical protein
MATVIDITNKIKNEEKFIVYNGKSYKVDDRKNTMIEVYAILNAAKEANIEVIDKAMEKLIGKAAVKDFAGFAYSDYLVPFFAALACVQNKTYEEIEDSFRKAQL